MERYNLTRYSNVIVEFVETQQMGAIITTKKMKIFLIESIKRKLSNQRLARLMDGCELLLPIVNASPRQWKRII